MEQNKESRAPTISYRHTQSFDFQQGYQNNPIEKGNSFCQMVLQNNLILITSALLTS